MCKANVKPEIKQMVISVKTKSMSKLLEAVIDAEDCSKELDQKDKSRRIQTLAPSTSKGKKKEEVFNIQTLKAPRKAQHPKDEVLGRRNTKGGKILSTPLTKLLKRSSGLY